MRSLLAAIQFLTIVPIPSRFQPDAHALRRGLALFPAVGFLAGASLALADWGLGHIFPLLPASILVVILMLAVSGGFHMDGLADTADGFFSSRPRERILEIMKDSHIGPMGVIAIVCILLLKASALASVPCHWHWRVVALMPLTGRCALILGMKLAPYARSQGGLASVFGQPAWPIVAGSLLLPVLAGGLLLGTAGVLGAAMAMLATYALSSWSRRKIGGFTGDTLGAVCELAESVPALVAASWRWPQ